MTASTPSTTMPRRGRLALLVVPLLAGVLVGGYLDWRWWHPTSGILITIVAIGLLVLAALGWAVRWKPIRPAVLSIAVFAIGLLLGQNFGPSRPPIDLAAGTLSIQLTEPADAQPTSGRADCQLTPDGQNFEIGGDPNIRLAIGDQPHEEQDTLQLSVARGDMWQYGEARSDGWSLIVAVSDSGPFTDEQMPGLWYFESTAASELVATGTQSAGSMTFDGLVLDATQSQGVDQALDLSGTIEWDCGS